MGVRGQKNYHKTAQEILFLLIFCKKLFANICHVATVTVVPHHIFCSYHVVCCCCYQGIINMNMNGNSANFFSFVCNGKKIKELFASTLNEITASGRCVSSMIVVLYDKST